MSKYIIIITTAWVLLSCGGTKKAINTTSTADVTTAVLIKDYYHNTVDFNTLSAKLKVKYSDNKKSLAPTLTLRAKKDEIIWVNAAVFGITVARAKITPKGIAVYEKIKGRYFEGDFDFLSRYFGVRMDFKQLQRLMLGNPVFEIKPNTYTVSEQQEIYKFTPKQQQAIANVFFFINKPSLTLSEQVIEQPQKNVQLNVTYGQFQKIQNQLLPENVNIKAKQHNDVTYIDLNYRSVKFNEEGLRFPFKIPAGYKEIRL